MKTTKTLYRIFTGLIALLAIPGILLINSEMTIQSYMHLGLPDWFRRELGIAIFLGGLVLIIPGLPHCIKERAYAGLGIVYISALVAHLAVDGVVLMSFSPIIAIIILLLSHKYRHKLQKNKKK